MGFLQPGQGEAELLREIRDYLAKLAEQNAPQDHPLKGRSVAAVPPAGFWGQNAAAPVPPPMPGSAAAMAAAGANQYNQPLGPQVGFQMSNPLGRYAPHEVGGPVGVGIGQDVLGFIPQALAGAASYAGGKTPYGTTGTTAELGLNLQMGMLKELSSVAGKVPGLGAYAEKQFAGLEEAVYGPEERARGRLSPTFERMAMAGINVSDREIEEAFQFTIPMERRGVYMKQRLTRIGAAVNATDALSSALSQIGM